MVSMSAIWPPWTERMRGSPTAACNWLPLPASALQAAFPVVGLRDWKFWPAVGRVDNVYGDRNLVCSCAGMEAYS